MGRKQGVWGTGWWNFLVECIVYEKCESKSGRSKRRYEDGYEAKEMMWVCAKGMVRDERVTDGRVYEGREEAWKRKILGKRKGT